MSCGGGEVGGGKVRRAECSAVRLGEVWLRED